MNEVAEAFWNNENLRDSAEDITGCFRPINNQKRCGNCDSCDGYYSSFSKSSPSIRDSTQYVEITRDEEVGLEE